MFGGNSSTEYDEIVAKTTDENLTSENWELILNLCDKVGDEGQEGAHAAVAAILKRLTHRNPNVQLYALSLSESLGKNLGLEIHREIASRAFTQGLEKLITDRNTHEKVRKRALGVIAEWAAEFENDESLGIMEDCYNNLKAKNYKFDEVQELPPPSIDDEIRRKEEEELQRVLEMSKQDLGRAHWTEYSLSSSTGAGPSGAGTSVGRSSSPTSSSPRGQSNSPPAGYSAPKYQGGYVPARTPSPDRVAAEQHQQQLEYQKQLQAQQLQQAREQQAKEQQAKELQAKEQQTREQQAREQAAAVAAPSSVAVPTPTGISVIPAAGPVTTSTPPTPNVNIVTRVRALYTFEPTEPGELAFEKGDIIKVVDRGYKDWWRGQLKGRTGIFPVNYVEPMPEPTATELGKEAEQEAAVFAQAINVQKLLDMLRSFDPTSDNLADNEEIQELYRSSMALRPKIVKLIDKYSQKRADLVSMNETFLRARTIFDRMMEESLARHTAVYDQPYRPSSHYGPHMQGRPGSTIGGPQPFGWGPNYEQQPPPQPGYSGYPGPGGPAPGFPVGPQSQSQPLPSTTPLPGQHPTGAGYGSMPAQGPAPHQGPPPQGPVPIQQHQPLPQTTPSGYNAIPVGGYAGHQSSPPYSQQGPTPYPVQPPQQQPQQQPQQLQHQPQQLYHPPQPQPYQPGQTENQHQHQHYQPAQAENQHQPQPYQPVQAENQHQPQLYQPAQAENQHQPQPYQPVQAENQHQPQPYQPAQAANQHQVAQVNQPVQQLQQPVQQPIQQAQPQILQIDSVAPYQPQTQFQPQPAASVASPQIQPELQPQPEAQPDVSPQPIPPQEAQAEPNSISQQQPQPKPAQPISGPPPYPYDPSYTYADQNAQAWASYYAQGGDDPTGSVYFISIPGVKEETPTFALPNQQPQQLQAGYDFSHEQPGDKNLTQGVSYQAQPQLQTQPFVTHDQPYQTRPSSDDINATYGAIGSIGGAPGAALEPAAMTMSHMPRYQLSDNPVSQTAHQQTQPQPNNDGYRPGPSRAGSGDNGYAAQPSSPAKTLLMTAPLNVKRGQSPTPASTTPSWVLPKKTNAPGFGPGQTNGGSPTADAPHYQAVRSE